MLSPEGFVLGNGESVEYLQQGDVVIPREIANKVISVKTGHRGSDCNDP